MRKIIILSIVFLFLITNLAQAKSIYEFFEIKKLQKIIIEVFSKDNWQTPIKTIPIQDNDNINKISGLLKKLPSTGEIYKEFGNIRIISIKIVPKKNKINELTIYGIRIRVPDNSGKGTFYMGPTEAEKEFVALIESIIGN